MIAQVKNLFNRQWSVMKGRIQMKKNKSNLAFIVLVVVIIMSMASTAFAASYSAVFINWARTSSSVSLINYVEDRNTICYYDYQPIYTTDYTSKAWYYNNGSYSIYSAILNQSGNTKRHAFSGTPTSGKLSFHNTQMLGHYCSATGNMY